MPGKDGESESIADKYFVCTECLVEGNVQSFVDLFYLTHSQDSAKEEQSQQQAVLKEESTTSFATYDVLQFLKNKLTEAEVAQREGGYDVVFESFMETAKHFKSKSDHKRVIYFLTKCLEVARISQDIAREAEANEMLGLTKEEMGQLKEAIQYHEAHRDLVVSYGRDMNDQAGHNLIRAYRRLAEELQKQGDVEGSIMYFQKSLKSAIDMGDQEEEGKSYRLLGSAYLLQQEYDLSASNFHKFLSICQETQDRVSEGLACSHLATAYEAKGDRASSIKFLEEYYEIALSTGELNSQREACGRLGIIFNAAADFNRSVEYFTKAFEISRSLGDKKAIDVDRVNLGIARGSAKQKDYIKVVNSDFSSLMTWKSRRIPFERE
uniref:Tetratricopeptide repeat protein 29 n=1 Tax=Hanusia phi TaxID=3032 RepID=A0A7S0ET62_9CRYP|mmetsp:Transcript_3020/g.7314  ORF Transcript_3020/g.7314 Transcript_3020/m.7314 type:complete len:380 (+) Transcript_3020:187-1326(+)